MIIQNGRSNSAKFILQTVLTHPKSRGTVRLNSSDPKSPPIIDFNYFSDADDLTLLAQGTLLFHEYKKNALPFVKDVLTHQYLRVHILSGAELWLNSSEKTK